MSRPMRIKVRVADLITKIEAAKAEAKVDYEKAVKQYDSDKVKYETAAVVALDLALTKATAGVFPKSEYSYSRTGTNYLKVPLRVFEPQKPELRLGRFDKDLGLLKACADETLMVSADSDFGRYL